MCDIIIPASLEPNDCYNMAWLSFRRDTQNQRTSNGCYVNGNTITTGDVERSYYEWITGYYDKGRHPTVVMLMAIP
jgi:hypothetical protein